MEASNQHRKVSIPEAIERATSRIQGLTLSLADIAFIAAFYAYREEHTANTIDEATIDDLCWQVCDTLNLEFDSINASAMVNRLRKGHILSCMDSFDMARAGSSLYALTPMAQAIAKSAIGADVLTSNTLDLILARITSEILAILSRLKSGLSDEQWDNDIAEPLNTFVMELLGAIENRQSAMERDQEDLRRRTSDALDKRWIDAMDECTEKIQLIMNNLNEIMAVYLRHNDRVSVALNEISQLALYADKPLVRIKADEIHATLNRIVKWSDDKLTGWTRYYKQVLYFMNDLMRTDPNRQQSKKIEQMVHAMLLRPCAFNLANMRRTVVFRDMEPPDKRVSVVRNLVKTEGPLESERVMVNRYIDQAIKRSQKNGKVHLVDVGRLLTDLLPHDKLWRGLGLISARLKHHGTVSTRRQTGWHRIDRYDTEDLVITVSDDKDKEV